MENKNKKKDDVSF